MIRALVVDDEPYAREELAELLRQTGAVEVVGCCANAIEAIKEVNRLRPEVLFLDIQMPMVNGFEMLAMINSECMPHVVFVTAYDEYSLKAFEEKTLDYLLKPVEPARLAKTIDKITGLLGSSPAPDYDLEPIRRIPCMIGHRLKLIFLADIDYVATDSAGVQVFTADTGLYTEITLKVLEERSPLLRCHRQYLVNPDKVSEIVLNPNGSAEIITQSGQKVPVSRRYLKSLKQLLLL